MKKRLNNFPKISVIIPSYNKVPYLKDTLRSIIDQEYPNLEVIIQDGGSIDGSVKIIKEFANKYPKIFKWVSQKDNGQLEAINKGFKRATGDILTFINADDLYKNKALINVGMYFMKNPNTLWVTGYSEIVNEKRVVKSKLVTKYKNVLLNLNNYFLLLMVNYISQPSTFLSRRAYEKFGPFVGTKKYVMEYDLWLKLGKVQMPAVIKKNLSSFRLAIGNISLTSSNELLMIDNEIVSKYTNNKIILNLHYLHNFGRIAFSYLI